ncbi:hypothetical protein E4T56_gene13881, partial [Termitomyces sp. T112]
RHAYWLIAGIAGIDPAAGSAGSAAWARYLVDGDMAHEIDAREIPASWKYGYFPIHGSTKVEGDPLAGPAPVAANGEMFALNAGLAQWAYGLTKDIKLPDDASIAAQRELYRDFPEAQKPPRVMMGDQLAAMTYWHGEKLTQWGRDWVKYWTHGKGTFVTSAMEETGMMQSLEYLTKVGRADRNRVMVLRAGSNFTMPPKGIAPAESIARENGGYSGLTAALEALYVAGSKVVGGWAQGGQGAMSRTLIVHADVIACMDDGETEIADGAIAFEHGVITAIGPTAAMEPWGEGAQVIDARGCVITPGLVNTHHHLYQSLTRAVPGCASTSLFGWLKTLYPIWARYNPRDIFNATRLGLAELALSGCTMSSDHLYLFPNGSRLDDSIAAACDIGIR